VVLAAVGAGLVLLAFAVGMGLCALARVLAPQVGLIDRPGGRKAHKAPTPLAGGVAIWLTTVGVLALGASVLAVGRGGLPADLAKHVSGLWSRGGELGLILGLATLIMIMGLIDDRFGLSWRSRLLMQFVLATILVACGVRVTIFVEPTLWGKLYTGALTVFWIVGLTNAFNFLDNMDGLAAGVGLIAALLFAGAQIAVESLFVPAVLLVLVGALGGFLVHNRHPARLFMGDAGSNFLGFLLGSLTVAGTFTRPGYSPYSVLTPLLVMAVPLYDTASVIIIRLREGRSPFQPDRSHFSHRLVDRGLTPPRAVATIYLVTLASGLGALRLHREGPFGACVVVGQTLCLLGVVALLELSTTRPERSHGETHAEDPGAPPALQGAERSDGLG
jgi:UDP-GlcNAc:undecaprenyl-phosphate GlcNAc-1-phosphate transferase